MYKVPLEDKAEGKDIISLHFHSTKHCQTKVEQQGTDIRKCNEMEKKVWYHSSIHTELINKVENSGICKAQMK